MNTINQATGASVWKQDKLARAARRTARRCLPHRPSTAKATCICSTGAPAPRRTRGDRRHRRHVAAGRAGDAVIWQSVGGTLVSASAK